MALALTIVVLAVLLELARPASSLTRSLPEAANVQQRLRHAFDRLHTDLIGAGRGTSLANPGPLIRYLPPLVPYRLGLRSGGAERRVPRSDAITTLSVSRGSGLETTLRTPIVGSAPMVELDSRPSCGPPACGYRARDLVLVFDDQRAWELFRVTRAVGMRLTLARAHATATVFGPGAVIAPVELHHYYAAPGRTELRHYDGWQGDFPLLDDLVDLRFRYFGPAAAAGPVCDTVSSDVRGPLVEIGPTELADGPWCGPAGLPFDGDLLRIRAVEVDLRVQSAVVELRGADPRLFRRPGPASGRGGTVPDHAVTFTVAPRNLGPWP
jgi:hypothetical protein